MVAETGHHPNRVYTDLNGDFHTNKAKFFNDDENDIVPQLNVLDTLVALELAFLDGALAGTPVASKAIVADANLESNSISVLKSADVLIATAAVKTLNATPVSLVAAPGAGKYLEFVRAYLFLDFAATAYDTIAAGEDLSVKYTDGSGAKASADIEATGFMDATADALAMGLPADASVAVANAALVLHMLVGEIATGDSPLKVRTIYREVRTASLEAIS